MEKTLKVVDWSKPIRMGYHDTPDVFNKDVKVLYQHNGYAYVTWGSGLVAYGVDEYGGFEHPSRRTVTFIENVPEEPKNCLVLIRTLDGSWFFDKFSVGVHGCAIPMTRRMAEERHKGAVYTWKIVEV